MHDGDDLRIRRGMSEGNMNEFTIRKDQRNEEACDDY